MQLVAASETDISAPTDDRPYFFQVERGIPSSLQPLTVLVALLALLLMGIYVYCCRRSRETATRQLPLYVAALGVGFIALEIHAIHQTRIFLGHPTLAVTLVLVTFLVGGGIGSGLSQLPIGQGLRQRPSLITALIVLALVIWIVLWSWLGREFYAANLQLRAAVVVLSLLPLTLFLGIPFPHALEFASNMGPRQIAIAWSVNGVMTVVGSVVSVVLSITLGFGAVLLLGAAAYSAATLISLWMQRREQS